MTDEEVAVSLLTQIINGAPVKITAIVEIGPARHALLSNSATMTELVDFLRLALKTAEAMLAQEEASPANLHGASPTAH